MTDKILILDFGSQYTQLIARKVRELNVYSEIIPYNKPVQLTPDIKGVILSGGPASVTQPGSPDTDLSAFIDKVPVLAICYGAQLIAQKLGGSVASSAHREYGRAHLRSHAPCALLESVPEGSQIWMSHGDSILHLPHGYELAASTDSIPVAIFQHRLHRVWGFQFHPEVHHSEHGQTMLRNFLYNVCGLKGDWTPAHFIEETVAALKAQIGSRKVVCALSGGVDSTVAATLVHQAVGSQLTCIFVNNGLLRKDEYQQVLEAYATLKLPVIGVDASQQFLGKLAGVEDPEQKRKIIGREFIEVFDAEAHKLKDIDFLVQGTIYPDVIESVSVNGPSATIKSHHNVGGLPEKMKLQVVEPLRYLFKDEVRRVGRQLGIPDPFLDRHPFPGPGLAIRILGAITAERVALLQQADALYIQGLRNHGLYNQVWQAFAVLLPVNSVGVMGDERTYENVLALRAVTSVDGMTADWAHLPYDFLAQISNTIINSVKGINRVVYDISSKPPATIEWE